MMPRRRGRVTVIVAAVLVFVLYKLFLNTDWDPAAYTKAPKPNVPPTPGQKAPAPAVPPAQGTKQQSDPALDPALEPVQHPGEGVVLPDREGSPPMHNPAEPVVDEQAPVPPPVERPDTLPDLRDEDEHRPTGVPVAAQPKTDADIRKEDMLVAVSALPSGARPAPEPTPGPTTRPAPTRPPRPPKPDNVKGLEDEEIHAKNPPDGQSDGGATRPDPPLHWQKQKEHFPVPTESLIPLPRGSPKPFPRIQHDFKPEAPADKEARVKRLAQVRAEAERAWAGYRKHAWTHDELTPVSLGYRDPFCGWAATLVDSLDTLWIMGLRVEFDEAVAAVKDIDFTYSAQRNTIPVFETVIRYLGGLLAAYDVSGGKDGRHAVLLDKALELAEILMGVFDTPNRMPVLYYNWTPEDASQPHRAAVGSIAELATMSMEFTRLAQLTGQDRFYDAVARITNALKALQDRGTSVPGIFPESLDMSGCNKTAGMQLQMSSQATKKTQDHDNHDDDDVPAGDLRSPAKPDMAEDEGLPRGQEFEPAKGPETIGRRDAVPAAGRNDKAARAGKFEFPELPANRHPSKPATPAADKHPDADCVPQGVEPASYGYQQYSMGGSQDSAYEYFPKEDLLLGGLEPVYKTLHINTVEAVDKWLLYRPMTKGERDLLFSAKLITGGNPANDSHIEYEVTHLTCFLGGMFALGGRMYDRPADVETARKLADGCVWAYESTQSGIMPEVATVVPCASRGSCPFNETLWWEYLDPQRWWRSKNIQDWEDRQLVKQRAREDAGKLPEDASADASGKGAPKEKDIITDDAPAAGTGEVKPVGKRAPSEAAADGQEQVVSDDILGQVPITELEGLDPRPMSHEEYVKDKIENDNIPPGFATVNSHNYILRPEAIESVWYMYRITGDTSWQDKGWRMFEAIIKATRTDAGHSAIENVLDKEPMRTDAMESFWLAETLKYFYLLFAEADLISLDEWVLNTEAHPFRRPT